MGAVAIAIPIDTFQLASNRVGLAVTVTEVGERLAAVNRRLVRYGPLPKTGTPLTWHPSLEGLSHLRGACSDGVARQSLGEDFASCRIVRGIFADVGKETIVIVLRHRDVSNLRDLYPDKCDIPLSFNKRIKRACVWLGYGSRMSGIPIRGIGRHRIANPCRLLILIEGRCREQIDCAAVVGIVHVHAAIKAVVVGLRYGEIPDSGYRRPKEGVAPMTLDEGQEPWAECNCRGSAESDTRP